LTLSLTLPPPSSSTRAWPASRLRTTSSRSFPPASTRVPMPRAMLPAPMMDTFMSPSLGVGRTCFRSYSCAWWLPKSSSDGVDVELDLVREARARPDGEDPVQPRVARVSGFEPRRRAEVVLGRIDGISALDPLHHLGRAVAQ